MLGARGLRTFAGGTVLDLVHWVDHWERDGCAKAYSDQELTHGGQAVTALQYLGTSQFWFESFQNWQSEFLAVAVIVAASVYLRQRGSPGSKPVADPITRPEPERSVG